MSASPAGGGGGKQTGSKGKGKHAKSPRMSSGGGAPSTVKKDESNSVAAKESSLNNQPATSANSQQNLQHPACAASCEGAQGGSNTDPSKDQSKQAKAKKPKAEPVKKPEGGEGGEQKSKAQLKAERRALQEAQRAAKEAKKKEAGGGGNETAAPPAVKKETTAEKPKAKAQPTSQPAKKVKPKEMIKDAPKGETEEEMWARKEKEILAKSLKIDNNILNLGFQYFYHRVVGANARCIAMLAELREVIGKYKTPPEKELCRDLEKSLLAPCITYINYCRPLSTSMGNAIKYLKYHINRIPSDMDDRTAIGQLQDVIDTFIQENILKASEAVALYANSKIVDGDVILVYAASSLICQVLKTAHVKGKKFRVIVVEGRPRTEGKSMLRFLVRCGIPCSYIYIGSATHAMGEATKVFLGAAAMFSIGDMHSRTGNSMIAALAQAYNIPVLACCETYKFTDKVQLHLADSNLHARGRDLIDPGPHNRPSVLLTSPEDAKSSEGSGSGGTASGPNLLNLMYDVTKSRHITMLVTELGMLPCTSVPVVLRRQEDLVAEV
ncbi:translation initiation factor eif-2b subunit delta [Plakobranchus ocellatus]|uniref:Translation initiation factor eIF2B subunit delta n=1 Tax=Plakobranchus ocellatus TaxID=259542 RepID=A0AAV4AST3_9GAST|nr:translation initiation factor eif-2b subunit delta [Plakobranchus ocellatus]